MIVETSRFRIAGRLFVCFAHDAFRVGRDVEVELSILDLQNAALSGEMVESRRRFRLPAIRSLTHINTVRTQIRTTTDGLCTKR